MGKGFLVFGALFSFVVICSSYAENTIIESWVEQSVVLRGSFEQTSVVASVRIDKNYNVSVLLSVRTGDKTIRQTLRPHLWSEGPIEIDWASENSLGIILTSLGIVEVYKYDLASNSLHELWNPNWNAGDSVVFVDWKRECIFATDDNTDKGLPDNFEYTLTMYSNSDHRAVLIDKSTAGPILFIGNSGTTIFYKKGRGEEAKELSVDYSGLS